MDKPLSVWYCDRCGGEIDNPKDGMVLFDIVRDLALGVVLHGNFSLVHHSKCDDGKKSGSMHLETFLGDNGRTHLLTFLSVGIFDSQAATRTIPIQVASIPNFVDFFRRVQVPYYEEARRLFFDRDVREHYAEFGNAIYYPDTLKGMIEKFS